MDDLRLAAKMGLEICQALGVPHHDVTRITLEIDMRGHEPIRLEVERHHPQFQDGTSGHLRTVIERYFPRDS